MSAPSDYGDNAGVQQQNPESQQQPGQVENPGPAPYQNVDNRHKEVCNPCCCCWGFCNLRRNCIAIAVFLIILGFVTLSVFSTLPTPVGEVQIPIDGNPINWTSCKVLLHPRIELPSGTGPHTDKEVMPCKIYKMLLLGWIIGQAFTVIFFFLSGTLLVVAAYGGVEAAAFAAATTIILSAICQLIYSNFMANHIIYFPEWQVEVTLADYGRNYYEDHRGDWVVKTFVATETSAIFWFGISIYLAVCSIQFGRQINAGIDLDPVPALKSEQNYAQAQEPLPPPYAGYGVPSPNSVTNSGSTLQFKNVSDVE